MQSYPDYYAILGVDPSASEEEIKQAYRALVRRYHPDVSGDESTVTLFQQIQEAYEVLSDPERRKAFDRWRAEKGLDKEPALSLEVTLSHRVLPVLEEDQLFYLLMEVKPAREIQVERLPLNLCVILDCSTSMQGAKLQRAKEAISRLVDHLSPRDIFSLVAFNDRAQVLVPASRGVDKALVKSKTSAVQSRGGTEMLQGLMAGLSEIERGKWADSVDHIILLTDGRTYGDEEACLLKASEAGERGIGITALGIGPDWNEDILEGMAERSGGFCAYIVSPSAMSEAFRDRIQSLTHIFARQLSLTVRRGEGVDIRDAFRISPYIARLPEAEGAFLVGTMEVERPLLLLLEVLVAPHPVGPHRLLQLEVQGDIPSLGRARERIRYDVEVEFQEGPSAEEVPSAILEVMERVALFKVHEKVITDWRQGNIREATRRLEFLATRLLSLGEEALAKAALLEAGRLSKTGRLSPEGSKRLRYGTRGLAFLPREVEDD